MNQREVSVLLAVTFGLFTISCSSNPRTSSLQDEGSGVVRGFYSWGFEVESFQPCGSDERWWVVGGDQEASQILSERYRELTDQPYERIYAELKGRPSAEGQFGHMGVYDREFALEGVVLVREARPGDCE